MCCNFWEKGLNIHKTGQRCSEHNGEQKLSQTVSLSQPDYPVAVYHSIRQTHILPGFAKSGRSDKVYAMLRLVLLLRSWLVLGILQKTLMTLEK